MKIVIVGGHHVSALVLAKLLRARDYKIFWFGTRYPRWPEKTEGIEYQQVMAAGFPFFDLKAGKFYKNFKTWWRIPLGFFQALWYLLKIRPKLIFSFGGYLAVPTVLAGWWLKIPAFTHEQTRTAGLANRFLKFFVRKIFLTWEKSVKFFPKRKAVLVGLPVREEILFPLEKRIFKTGRPTILVVGGKQGSHVINCSLEKVLEKVLRKYNVIHQCGEILGKKDLRRLSQKRDLLPLKLRKRYFLQDFFSDEQIGQALNEADFVVSRAGAHIVYELALLKKPAIFIPLPFAFAEEQKKNADLFVKVGAGKIIPQQKLDGEILFKAIEQTNKKLNFYKKNAQKLSKFVRKDAEKSILEYIEKFAYEEKKK